MTLPTASATAHEQNRPEPPFNIALVEEMLRLFARAVRAHQLYLHNNPTYLRALENLKGAVAAIWNHADDLTFEVADTQLKWEGHVVVNEPDKTGDALPWVLYKDGIREVRLVKGVEEQELVMLLQIIARVRKASPDEDDLLTLLWEHEFSYIKYRYVDLSFETAGPIEASDEAGRPLLIDPAAVREPPTEHIAPPGVVNLADFDATLYFLEESEIEYLRGEISRHYTADLRGNVVTILLDVFEQQTDPAIRDEVCGVLDGLLVQLLSSGHLRSVAYMLREVNIASNRARDLTPAQRELVLSLPNRMSEPDALAQLLQALDERVDLPAQEDLNELFDQLRVGALGTIFAWLSRLQSPAVRKLLEGAAGRLAAANTTELIRLIGSNESDVALEAVRRAGGTRAAAAVPSLARLLTLEDAAMRLAAVQALTEIGSAGALQQLERAIDDSDRDVRVATAKALSASNYRAALPRIEASLKGRRIQDADLTERMALFEAYGSMCGDGGVTTLDGYLNGKGLFGKREDPELRACAALALGKVGSVPAVAALRKASSDKEILVRNAVNRALRGGPAQ